MRGEVRAAAIERKRAPAPAERWDAAIPVLQTEQPLHARRRGRPDLGVVATIAEGPQRQERTGCVVAVGHAAGEIGPCPAARRGLRVRMHDRVLLIQQPAPQVAPFLCRQRTHAQCVDR